MRVPALALTAALAAALIATPAAAQKTGATPGARSITFTRIEAEYNILRSGDVMVTERLTVRFDGSWNGIERMLIEQATKHDLRPTAEREADPDTTYRDIDIDVLGATDADGTSLRHETSRSGDDVRVRIWVPGANDATRTVVLRYRIEEGVTFFAEHDEFYWNALGTQSTAPVEEFEARIIPPEDVIGLRARAFAGAGRSEESNARVSQDGVSVLATSTAALGPGRDFTIVVGWDDGVIERPGAGARLMDWLSRYWGFVLPILSLAFMRSHWQRRGRDPEMLPIVTRYEPVADITPGEVGTLLDERADMRDVTATLVDLAVQGRLRIEEIDGTKFLGLEFGEDYRFVETSPPSHARPVESHEAKMLDALFSGRNQVDLSDLKNKFYRDLPGIRDAMMDSLLRHGVYQKRPDKVRAAWVAAAVVVGMVLFGLLAALPSAPAAILLVPPLSALPVAIFGWLMPSRTVKGTRIIEKLRGFREFLSRVDGDRLRRMKVDPSAFERILPYAMAMGVEEKWGKAFEGLAQQPPDWYRSRHGGAFHTASFVGNLGRMSTATAANMSSSPSSSGSGGSGGSGFSGGSVGGGGGGGGVGGF